MNSGNVTRRKRELSELGSRDRQIVNEVIRTRVLTNEAVHAMHFPEASLNATSKVTARLKKQGWLKSFAFVNRSQYFVAGVRTIRLFGLPASRIRPLGPQALAMQLALLDFVARSTPQLRVLTEHEVESLIASPAAYHRGIPHVIEPGQVSGIVRIVRVDLGGSPAHVVSKLQVDIRSRVSNSQYANLVSAKKLVLATLTATDTKKSLIEDVIRKKSWPDGLRFTVFVTPVLCQLLGGLKSNGH